MEPGKTSRERRNKHHHIVASLYHFWYKYIMSPERRSNSTIDSPLTEYLSLPKGIGDVPSDRLFSLAHKALDFQPTRRDDQPNHATQPQLIAASALIEGVLVETNNSIDQVDTYLEVIDFARELYEGVANIELQNLELGFNHPDDQEDWLRAQLQLAFIDVYKDMACGEVTTDRTKPEVIEKLTNINRHVLSQLKHHKSKDFGRDMAGLRGELAVLLRRWGDFKHDDESIALPSTYRGGSGQFNRRDTHDIVFAQRDTRVNAQRTWQFSTAEVKRGNKRLRLDDLVRYTSPLIQVGYGRDPEEESIREVA